MEGVQVHYLCSYCPVAPEIDNKVIQQTMQLVEHYVENWKDSMWKYNLNQNNIESMHLPHNKQQKY